MRLCCRQSRRTGGQKNFGERRLAPKDEDDGCFLGDCDVAADDGEICSPVVDGCRARERSLGREHLQAPLPKPCRSRG